MRSSRSNLNESNNLMNTPEDFEEDLIDLADEAKSSTDDDMSSEPDIQIVNSPSIPKEDIFIAVMGVTGAGKSSFISQLTKEEVIVGHDLESCTSEPGVYSYFYKGHTIHLVDTPGFNDTNRTDTDILTDIAFFLSAMYRKKMKFSGIIYLHRITDVRMTGSSNKNLTMLEKLCGPQALSQIVLATTMWNLLGKPGSSEALKVGEQREAMLRDKFWAEMERNGASVMRYWGNAESGEKIISRLLQNKNLLVLDIQREMVDKGLDLNETSAGLFLDSDNTKIRKKYERDLAEAQESLEEALKEKDKALIEQFSQQREATIAKIDEVKSASMGLKVNFASISEQKDQKYTELAKQIKDQKNQNKAEITFMEQALGEMQDQLEKQQREHVDSMRRMMRSQNAKSVEEKQRIAQLEEAARRRDQELMERIAQMEQERKGKESKKISKAWTSFVNLFSWGDDESYHYDSRRHHRGGNGRYHRGYY